MLVNDQSYRTIWVSQKDQSVIRVIDQRYLPHKFSVVDLRSVEDVEKAIADMIVRGAGLIGVTAAYGMYLATLEASRADNFDDSLQNSATRLIATRPTAVNLQWAVEKQLAVINGIAEISTKISAALDNAEAIANADAEACRNIGIHGAKLIRQISDTKNNGVVNILTHCNAGWLAFTDYGSALSPVYEAARNGIKVHVWVDETRPRNQGAHLTAWELEQQKIPYSVICDNTGGHLMQHGQVDLVIVGADRVTRDGDVANKIGTYLKALAAMDNNIPFYVAFPASTIDWDITDGIRNIPIEERNGDEVKYVQGLANDEITRVLITPAMSHATNYGFDVTPARLISGFITEHGLLRASEEGLNGISHHAEI